MIASRIAAALLAPSFAMVSGTPAQAQADGTEPITPPADASPGSVQAPRQDAPQQSPSSAEAIADRPAQDGDRAGEVVVTARRREERLQDVPIAVTVVGGNALREANIFNVQEVQQKVPGLTLQPSQFGSNVLQPTIRGQRQGDPYLTRDQAVAVYFADVIQNRAQGLNSALYDLDSVQVLKGPQGTLFGRNTTGGAMIITPRAPTNQIEGYVVGALGNYDARRFEGALNVPFADWAALRVAGQIQRRDGYTRNYTRNVLLDDEHKNDWRASLRLGSPGGLTNTTVVNGFAADENGTGFKLYAGAAPPFQAELARLRALPFWSTLADSSQATSIKTFGLSNVTQAALLPGLTIKNIFGYRYVRSNIAFDIDGSAVTLTDLLGVRTATGQVVALAPSREDMTVRQYSDEFQVLGTVLDGSLDYIAGGFYFLERGQDQQTSGGLLGVSLNGVYVGERATLGDPIRNLSYSGFAQVTYRLPFLQGVSLTAGGRETYDRRELTSRNYTTGVGTCRLNGFADPTVAQACSLDNRVSYKRFTYTLSLDYKIRRDLLVYVAHRKGYRSGGFNISATTPAQFVPFQPEDVNDYEIGLKSTFDLGPGSATFNVAVYRQDYKNIQRNQGVLIGNPPIFAQVIVNAASAKIDGFEAELSVRPVPWLDFGVAVANLDARYNRWVDGLGRDLSASRFVGAPEWTISANAGVTIPVGRSELRVRADYYSQTETATEANLDPTTGQVLRSAILPGWNVLNGRVELRDALVKNFSIGLFGRNLLNERYYSSGQDLTSSLGRAIGFGAFYPGAPRTYGVETRFQF